MQQNFVKNNVDLCDHDNLVKISTEMEKVIDGIYWVPFFCKDCNWFVYEEYEYNGITVQGVHATK